MNKIFRLEVFISILALCCSCSSNETNSFTDKADSTKVGNKEIVSRIDSLAIFNCRAERNRFPDTVGWIKLVYHSTTDTIYGYRHKDTLHVEGDIVFIYKDLAKGAASTLKLWPHPDGRPVIPFIISNEFKKMDSIIKAMGMWANAANVIFTPKTTENDYVRFTPSENTQSLIGRYGGAQKIEISAGANAGNIAHEIGHALGLYHEMARSDRNSYVRVFCLNDVNYRNAYKSDPYARDLGPYDFYSIMHYPPDNCMEILDPGLPAGIPGQRVSISKGDRQSILQIYK